jgi:hypothetical protein
MQQMSSLLYTEKTGCLLYIGIGYNNDPTLISYAYLSEAIFAIDTKLYQVFSICGPNQNDGYSRNNNLNNYKSRKNKYEL